MLRMICKLSETDKVHQVMKRSGFVPAALKLLEHDVTEVPSYSKNRPVRIEGTRHERRTSFFHFWSNKMKFLTILTNATNKYNAFVSIFDI